MAMAAMMVASVAMSAMQTRAQNKSLQAEQRAADEASARQVAELKRVSARENEAADEQKSDRAKVLDRDMGAIVASGADNGMTAMNTAAFAGAAGAVAGLDLGRIESNRQEQQWSRRYESVSIIEENQARREQTKRRIKGNNLAFFGKVVGMGMKAVSGGTGTGSPDISSPTPPAPPWVSGTRQTEFY